MEAIIDGVVQNAGLRLLTPEEERKQLLKEAKRSIRDSRDLLHDVEEDIGKAKGVAALAGLSVESHIVEAPAATDGDGPTATTTGGFSNSDHVIIHTGDRRKDRLAELKRALLRRTRSMLPEDRRDERWDKPKAPGERRRKIVLEKDLDESPPEPPATGWMIYLGQMTTKYRHDDPRKHHDQAKALKEIGSIWKSKLTEDQRDYYQEFATQAREEYQRQVIEYRATGSYTESLHFKPLEGTNIWVRLDHPCELEREILGYETVKFAPRPPELDAAYEERQVRSIVKRKLKLKNLLDKDGNPKKGVDFEKMVDQERRRRLKRKREEEEKEKSAEEEKNEDGKQDGDASHFFAFDPSRTAQHSGLGQGTGLAVAREFRTEVDSPDLGFASPYEGTEEVYHERPPEPPQVYNI